MRQFAVLAFAAMLAAPAYPSEPAVTQPQQQFSDAVSVGYVMIPFTAVGSKGVPLTDLRERDVALYVDGVRVKNDLFEASQDAPVSFTILLDGSGSMALAGKMDAARKAVATLMRHRHAGDDFALYVFDDAAAHEVVPFTRDANAVLQAIDRVKPFGKTAFFDAIATMPERSRLGANPTRAIILLSDGIDNASHLTRGQLASVFEGIAVPIYPLGLREPAEGQPLVQNPAQPDENLSDVALLSEVATLTGGKLYVGNQPEQLANAVDSIDRTLRAQYLIGFSPTGRGDVKYRHITLQIPGRARSIRVRAGYRGTEPPVLTAKRTERNVVR